MEPKKQLDLWEVNGRFQGHCGSPAYNMIVYVACTGISDAIAEFLSVYSHATVDGLRRLGCVHFGAEK